jgi:hypothetical protein
MSDLIETLATPEQRAAIKFMEDHMPPLEIFKEVADSIPQTVPDAGKKFWSHGSCRVVGMIGGCAPWNIECGLAPQDIDLTDIKYVGFYRQAVANKRTGELKAFCVTVPLDFSGEVVPGQTIPVNTRINVEWDRDDLVSKARVAFLKLQEIVVEFYNAE